MSELHNTNTAIIEDWVPGFQSTVHEQEQAFNIKHKRTMPILRPRIKLVKKGGEVKRIVVVLNKGLVMTHKGKGKSGQRKEKPFMTNTSVDDKLNELADALLLNTADVIVSGLSRLK